jgi:uncharacterized protein YjgD (DUF1641 family)
VQQDNMRALLRLLETLDKRRLYLEEITELHRELGEFDEAAQALTEGEEIGQTITRKLLSDLIQEKRTAPVRFRL